MDEQGILFQAIPMYQRDYKERDLIVKILTRTAGKRMFYIKNGKSRRYPFAAEIQPLTIGEYEGKINRSGFSFINDVKKAKLPQQLMLDVERNAYATYILGLIDAAFVDNQPIEKWYDWVEKAITELNEHPEFDAQGLANYFEVQLLPIFGFAVTWDECVICGRRDLPLDFSESYQGTLCQLHWEKDPNRFQANGKSIKILQQFAKIDLRQLHSLTLKDTTKADMTRILDKLYDDQLGLHLRSKSFIRQLNTWSNRIVKRTRKGN